MSLVLEGALRYYTLPQPGKYLSKLCHYVDFLTMQRDYAQSRVQTFPSRNANGIALLERIISMADVDALHGISSDMRAWTAGIAPYTEDFNRMFNAVTLSHGVNSHFIRNETQGIKCKEYLLAVSTTDPLMDFPFGQGWDSWKDLRPLRLVNVDSNELTFHTFYDQLSFRNQPAIRAVITIDSGLLVMQYLKYLEYAEQKNLPEISVAEYLHTYVVIPSLQKDALSLWLLKVYTRILRVDTGIYSPMDSYWESANYGRIGGWYNQTVEEVRDLATWVTSTQMLPCRFLSSLNMPDGSNVNKAYHAFSRSVTVPAMTQYLWANMLISDPWNDLIFMLVQRQKQTPEFKTLRNMMRPEIQLVYAARPWSNIHDSVMAGSIRSRIEQWRSIFDINP